MASTDTPEDNKGFAEKNEATFPILSDTDRTVSAAYGVLSGAYAKRWTFYIGPDGTIRKIDREVDPRTAGADLVKSLEALEVPLAAD